MADHINLKDLLKGTGYEEVPSKVKQHSDIVLPKGKRIVLQAGSDKNARGLVVTWNADGDSGYDIAYWYDKPSNIVSAELKGDGESFGDIKNVYLGFHPELDEDDE